MSSIEKIIYRSLFFTALTAAALIALPTGLYGQCNNWEMDEFFIIEQRGAQSITVRMTSTGKTFAGPVEMDVFDEQVFGKLIRTVTGNLEGTITGDRIDFKIFWQDGLTGVYTARIRQSGKLEGETYDKAKPNIIQTWHSAGPLTCKSLKSASTGILKPDPKKTKLPSGPKTLDPRPAPGGSVGTSKPSGLPPAPMKVPGIIASQVIYPQAYASTGFVILSWDAGPDHPYAEVWYKVNNGDDTFLIELGKGSRQMPVERGKYYTYILTDAGKTLATINVVGN